MSDGAVKVNVIIDDKVFHKFSLFESFYRKRGYLSPLIFALILSVSAIICFMLGGALLGVVLLIVGLGLPTFHIQKIFRAIKMQIRVLDLENPKTVYTLRFTEANNGIEVSNHGGGDEPLYYEWISIHAVYRVDGCIYLYVLPEKAFLLPDGQAEEGTDALWQLLTKMIPSEKVHDRRKK